MRRSAASVPVLALVLASILTASAAVAPAARAEEVGLGVKWVLYPWGQFGPEQVFLHLRVGNFLGVEGLETILEGGLGLNLRTISLDAKLLLTRFALDGTTLTPFTGGGLALEVEQGWKPFQPLHLALIPEGLAGIESSLPPLFLFLELRVRSLRGMVFLIGLGLEF